MIPRDTKQGIKIPSDNTNIFVLDASVTMSWSFEDETDAYADTVLDSLQNFRAVVPSLWPLEVANTLLVGERRQRIMQVDSLNWVRLLAALPITVDDETNFHAWTTTMSLAREQKLSAYDAAYLELAMRRNLPIATLDARLRAAAKTVGVAIHAVH